MNPFFGFGFGFASSWSEISRNLSCNGFRIRIPDSGFASSCYRKSTMDSQDMDSGFGFPVLKLDSGFGFAKWIRIRQMDSDSLTRRTATRTKTVIITCVNITQWSVKATPRTEFSRLYATLTHIFGVMDQCVT